MELNYDIDNNRMLYSLVQNAKAHEKKEVHPNVHLGFDQNGKLATLEVDNAFEMIDKLDRELLAMMFQQACRTPSDIHEHLPVIYNYACDCEHVTEFGVRTGNSTLAFLAAQPKKLVSYDIERFPQVDLLEKISCDTQFEFHKESTLEMEIEPTDLLMVDSLHIYDQVKGELDLHGDKARKFIVFHDTVQCGERWFYMKDGEKVWTTGIRPAIDEFLQAHPEWKIKEERKNNNGLMIVERTA